MKKLTLQDWKKEGEKLYGTDMKKWKFVCAQCGETQTLQDFIDNKVKNPEERFFFSCIGRWDKKRGCDWTLGGLLTIHKTEVINEENKTVAVFEFKKNK
jgi:hypothetical protein